VGDALCDLEPSRVALQFRALVAIARRAA